MTSILNEIYKALYKHFGPQYWWPAKTKFEVIVGAILTQNTNWGNVEKALQNLKKHRLLAPKALHQLTASQIARYIKPAGYFNVKARRLKNFLDFFFREYNGSLPKMRKEKTSLLREKLLAVNGIGPETADSIILYAMNKPVFVVDAYTKRFLARHHIVAPQADYHTVQELFTKHFDPNAPFYNEYHALIVNLGKDFCKPKARCDDCPLDFLNGKRAFAYKQ